MNKDPKPGWPFPFPAGEVPDFDDAELRADVDALRRLCGEMKL